MKMTNRKNMLKNKGLMAILGTLLVVLLGAWLIGPRLLYGNPLFQAWVQSQIADQTKGTFKFETIKGSIFSADLKDLYLDLDGSAFNVQKVEAPEMIASFALIPLLKNELSIKSLVMKGGVIQIRLNGGDAPQIALPVADSFRLKKGTIRMGNLSGWNLELTGCDLKAEQSGSGASPVIEGTIYAAQAKIGKLLLEELEGSFRIENGVLHVEKVRARLPGKSALELSGSYELSGKRSLKTNLSVNSPDVRSLLVALDFSDKFSGEAELSLQAEGVFTPDRRLLNGAGKAALKKIKPSVSLPRFPAFNDAPIFVRARNLGDLKGPAAFQLNKEKIVINELNLKNSDVQITGSAVVGYDRSLSSNLTFTGNKTVDAEIPSIARDSFKHDADGNVIIPFELRGSTRDPQVDVGDVLGRVLSNPIKALNPLNLFH